VAEARAEARGDYRLVRTAAGEAADAAAAAAADTSSSEGEGFLDRTDVHTRLMRRYKDAPMSWYLLTLVSMLAMGIFVVE
jgi:hypothetical protein